jgi:pre-mRNA-splicing factor ATP-dependent RNA helicase DHX38/PRP16
MQCVTSVDGTWLAELGPMFFSVKDSSTSKLEARKKYANEVIAMENEMKEAQEKIEQQKKERESMHISSRKTNIITPGRNKDDIKKEMLTPHSTRRKFGL